MIPHKFIQSSSENDLINSSFNFRGLPCIRKGNFWVLFNPYQLKAYKINAPKDLSSFDPESEERLHSPLHRQIIQRQSAKNLHFTVVMTTDCNLSCQYCYAQSKKARLYLDFDLAKEMVQSVIGQYSQRELFFHYYGGEPTLNGDVIFKLTEFIRRDFPNAYFYISTNGVIQPQILEFLIKNRFGFYLSIDSLLDYEQGAKQKGFDPTFEATLAKITTNRLPLKIRTTVYDANVEQMPGLAEALFQRGVKFFHLTPVNQTGFAKHNSVYQFDTNFYTRFLDILPTIMATAKRYQARVITPLVGALSNPGGLYCKGLDKGRFVITPEGYHSLCLEVQGVFNSYSNLFLAGQYDRVRGEFRYKRTVRSELMQHVHKAVADHCSKCFAQFICNGGCPLENVYAADSLSEISQEWCYFYRRYTYFLIDQLTLSQSLALPL